MYNMAITLTVEFRKLDLGHLVLESLKELHDENFLFIV